MKIRQIFRPQRAIALALFFPLLAVAHGGRTDKSGGHNCSEKSVSKGLCTGYHFHQPKTTTPAAPKPQSSEFSAENSATEASLPPAVKKSRSGLCHSAGSTYYSQTKNFQPFETLEDCLKNGGNLPKTANSPSAPPSTQDPPAKNTDEWVIEPVTLNHVVDGDTVKVNFRGKSETLRIIGIDTPETKDPRSPVQCFGEEATAYAKTLLEDTEILIETKNERGKYGRLLAYLEIYEEDFGEIMIRDGYAFHYRSYPHQRMKAYDQAENLAENSAAGLWAEHTCGGEKKAKAPTPTAPPPPELVAEESPTPAELPAAPSVSETPEKQFSAENSAQKAQPLPAEENLRPKDLSTVIPAAPAPAAPAKKPNLPPKNESAELPAPSSTGFWQTLFSMFDF